MKRIPVIFAAVVLLFTASSKSVAQVYEPGNFVGDVYMGWPNLFTSVVKTAYNNDPDYSIKISSVGPLGARFEYLISSRIGIGVHFNYANTSVKGTYNDAVYDPVSGTTTTSTYNYKASIPRFRVMPMVNIHLGNSKNVDPYIAFGGGYGSMKIKETTNDPNFRGGSVSIKATPVALRAEFGVRYFFTDHIGINGSFGIGGGPLLGAGLSGKF